MFDISWSHLGIFALAAIVLVPSKDLPALLRTIGRYVGDAKRMAREFRSQVDDALRESELADIKKSVEKEVRDIESSASLADTERSLNAALNAPVASAQPTGQIIPSVAAALPVEVAADTAVASAEPAAAASTVTVPMPMNGARAASIDGIEVVSAGRGSVAQRAAAAWKTTAGHESGA